ncbi:hypothetical protein [Nocardia salmonicida]
MRRSGLSIRTIASELGRSP